MSHNDARLLIPTPDDSFWAATTGGIMQFSESGFMREYTMGQGLYGVGASALVYDEERNYIWQGYGDGTLERIAVETGSIVHYGDIRRSERFATNSINDLQFHEGSLYSATDFGIVVFDPVNGLVSNSYVNLGELESGTRVLSISFQGNRLIAATDGGVAIGSLDEALEIPDNWSVESEQEGLPDAAISRVLNWQEQLIAFSADASYIRENEQWNRTDYFMDRGITSVSVSSEENYLTAVRDDSLFIRSAQDEETLAFDQSVTLNYAFYSEENFIYTSSIERGVLLVDPDSGTIEDEILPEGPFSNIFTNMDTDGSTLISGSSKSHGSAFQFTGFYIFSEGNWGNFNRTHSEYMDNRSIRGIYRTGISNAAYYFGSFGNGVVRYEKETGDMYNFRPDNSPLAAFETGSNFAVTGGITMGPDGDVWIGMWSEVPEALFRYEEEEEEWTSYDKPPELAGNNRYYGLKTDSNGQLWSIMADEHFQGRGIGVIRHDEETGELSAIRLTDDATTGNLPHEMVNDIAEDRLGEIWVATNRGIARFNFPGNVIDGGPQERQASLILNADTTATSPFLLNNVQANAIEVNAANQKWIGTEDAGLWLISPVGGRYEVLEHFTAANSPLISDNIISLALDETSGKLYIATDIGLTSYVGTAKAPEAEMDELRVFPNPYEYREQSGNIVVEGLSGATQLNILTSDGRVVNRIDTRGGRVEWNARDFQGNRVGSGVYVLVAVDEDTDKRGVGKVVIIR